MANNDKSTLSPQQAAATLINGAIRNMPLYTAQPEQGHSGEVRRGLTEDELHGYYAELCAKLNDSIASQSASGISGNATSFETHRDAIEDLFSGSHQVTGQSNDIILIIQRLALIDLFYSTNVNGMRQFGLSHIAKAIIRFGSDSDLAQQAIAFVKAPSRNHNIAKELILKDDYGYDKDGDGMKATSLISKYLFFLVNAHGDKVGFPIYDSVVRDLLPALADKLGLNQGNKKLKISEMTDYTIAVKNIISALSQNDSDLWNTFGNATYIKSQCDLLDYFLWRIGKAGNLSFSLLVTENELKSLTKPGPSIIAQIKNIKKDTILTHPELFDKLPQRLTIWHILYLILKK
ncbi:MAG: hypothetical protein ACI30K_00675 [Muribaculaceae bacterium]